MPPSHPVKAQPGRAVSLFSRNLGQRVLFPRNCLKLAAACLAGIGFATVVAAQQPAKGQESNGPLVARGYTEAPEGTVVIGGNPGGGAVMLELRVTEGQLVKRGDVLGILSGYPGAQSSILRSEAELQKVLQRRAALESGFRVAEIDLQRIALRKAESERELMEMMLARSTKPVEIVELEQMRARRAVERQKILLRLLEEKLVSDLRLNDADIALFQALRDNALEDREAATVRAPIDGVVTEIAVRTGGYVDPRGLLTIVDIAKLRVVADIDEIHRRQVAVGTPVTITLRSGPTAFSGRVSRVSRVVKRMERLDPSTAPLVEARLIQVEAKFDDPASVPYLIGHEARIVFH